MTGPDVGELSSGEEDRREDGREEGVRVGGGGSGGDPALVSQYVPTNPVSHMHFFPFHFPLPMHIFFLHLSPLSPSAQSPARGTRGAFFACAASRVGVSAGMCNFE